MQRHFRNVIESKTYLLLMNMTRLLLTKRGNLIFKEFMLEREISNIKIMTEVIQSTRNWELFLKVNPGFLSLTQIILFA